MEHSDIFLKRDKALKEYKENSDNDTSVLKVFNLKDLSEKSLINKAVQLKTTLDRLKDAHEQLKDLMLLAGFNVNMTLSNDNGTFTVRLDDTVRELDIKTLKVEIANDKGKNALYTDALEQKREKVKVTLTDLENIGMANIPTIDKFQPKLTVSKVKKKN